MVCFSFHLHSLSSACKTTHQECHMGSTCQWTSDTNSSATLNRQTSSGVHLVEKQMFTGHFDFWMVQIGQKKICVNTMWRIVPFVESHSCEHHQKECLCPVNQMNNHREHAWLFSIFTTTTLPLGWPIRQGQQFNLAWETFILWPFSFVFLKCFDDRS